MTGNTTDMDAAIQALLDRGQERAQAAREILRQLAA